MRLEAIADSRCQRRHRLLILLFACSMAMAGCSRDAEPSAAAPPPPAPTVAAAPSVPPVAIAPVASQDDALSRLMAALKAHGMHDMGCLSFSPETAMAAGPESAQPAWHFAVREIHDPPCKGDPATAPLRARYRVSADGALAEYDTAADVYRPLASAAD